MAYPSQSSIHPTLARASVACRAVRFLSYPASVPFPSDPSDTFPRVISVSSTSWQGVSLGGEPASVVGWSVRRPRKFCMNSRVLSVFNSRAMNDAAQVVSELISKIMYPIAGIWLGPVYVHMPSGNVVLQLTVPGAGPLDPVPVFTYNSHAARSEAGRGYGVSDLFNPTIESLGSGAVSLIDGTGKSLVYSSVGIESWGMAPASARNGLKLASDGSWVERQPDGLQWIYDPTGFATKAVSPSGDIWCYGPN